MQGSLLIPEMSGGLQGQERSGFECFQHLTSSGPPQTSEMTLKTMTMVTSAEVIGASQCAWLCPPAFQWLCEHRGLAYLPTKQTCCLVTLYT